MHWSARACGPGGGSARRWRRAICVLAIILHSSLITHHSFAQGVITTVAGTEWVFRGDGGPAINAPLGETTGVAVDSAGNVFAADIGNHLVVKVSPAGILTVVAGTGNRGFSGDGGLATSAGLNIPRGVALDRSGNLYIADDGNSRVRKVSLDGTITTVAGSGRYDYSGDGGPATSAALRNPRAVAVDAAGNLYIADSNNHRIRKVGLDGIISTVAGNGVAAFSGDGGPAISASLNQPNGVAVDAAGNLYIADSSNNRIRKVPPGGIITTVAGNGQCCFSGDGGPAVSATLGFPAGVAVDGAGNLYSAEPGSRRVRKVNAAGIISTVAGNGVEGFSGDGGSATSASLYQPRGVAVDGAGSLYVADQINARVRKIGPGGTINTIAGNGLFKFPTDGVPATNSFLRNAPDVAVDAAGNLYIAQPDNHRVRKVRPDGIITTVAGSGVSRFSGDGGPATSASLAFPLGVAVDAAGNLYIADSGNSRVRRVSLSGVISTVAGNGNFGFSGDAGPATSASLADPQGVAVDVAGNLYIVDRGNQRIRKVSPGGVISTVAGNGIAGFSGDGGPATGASLRLAFRSSVAADAAGNLYIADTDNRRIRKVSPDGIITTVAGDGVARYAGDGGPAVSASLSDAHGLAVDAAGNLYIADTGNQRIRKVSPDGTIGTVAGGGRFGFSGDGGLATSASVRGPHGVAVDAAGNLYIADTFNERIRKVLATAPSFSVAPASLTFSAAAGTPVVPAQQITTSSNVTGLVWRVEASTEDGAPWLSFSPPVGLTPGTIAVSVNAASLAPGNYRGTVTVQAPLGATPTQTVAVQLAVREPGPPQLLVEPSTLGFEILTGAGNPPPQTLRISNGGDGTIQWTARAETTVGGNWLSVSPASGSASAGSPATVTVSASPGSLVPGVYSGSVRVESPTTGQTQTVAVTLLVSQLTQTILVSQSGLLFTGVEGGGLVPSQSFGILNIAQGAMNWTVEATTLSGGNWLSVSPSSGRSDAGSLQIPQVEVAVNVAGLRAGAYSGLVRVIAPGANNSPQSVTVVLNVLPAGSNPGVLVRPTGLIFAAQAGATSPVAQAVTLATAAPGSLGFVNGLLTFDGGAWLEAGTRNGVLSAGNPATIGVQPSVGGLAPGIYRGTLALLFGDGSSQTVNILFLVVARAAGAASAGNQSEAAQQCAPQRLLGLHRSLGSNPVSPVGWPTIIEVQAVDDCGNAAPNATVVASFSNGDPPLVLNSLRNGIYTGTWRPANPLAQVVVRVRASLPPLVAADLPPVQLQVSSNPAASALNAGGIVNAASFAPGAALAPGSIVSVFGRRLAASTASASRLPLPTTLGGATLNVGGRDVPLFFSSDGQVNAQLPFELAPNSRPQVVVRGLQAITVPETITIGLAHPGIFSTNQQGTGQGAILDVQGRLVDGAAPATAGEVVQVFATGLGPTQPPVPSGQAAPGAEPLARVVVPVEARVGGRTARVLFAGLAPGFVGLYQVNVEVPAGVAAGPEVPLLILQNGVPSNAVTLALR